MDYLVDLRISRTLSYQVHRWRVNSQIPQPTNRTNYQPSSRPVSHSHITKSRPQLSDEKTCGFNVQLPSSSIDKHKRDRIHGLHRIFFISPLPQLSSHCVTSTLTGSTLMGLGGEIWCGKKSMTSLSISEKIYWASQKVNKQGIKKIKQYYNNKKGKSSSIRYFQHFSRFLPFSFNYFYHNYWL